MSPERLQLTLELAERFGMLSSGKLRVESPNSASDAALSAVHDPEYLMAVKFAPGNDSDLTPEQWSELERFGLATDDNPLFPHMHEVAARIAGYSATAALAVWNDEAEHAVNLAGGLHHAMPASAAGFCIYNDAAVAISQLLAAGAKRVLYLDLDAHHGDGVERAFWNDNRVLTISIHQTGASLYPGTGFPTDIGALQAPGYAVNIALPARTADAGWLRALTAVVPQLLAEFQPEFIVSQHGVDGHLLDDMSDLQLSTAGLVQAMALVHDWAHEFAAGRWLALGGGGYRISDVVPPAWVSLLAVVSHQVIPPEILDIEPAVKYADWSGGFDPNSSVDRAIRQTRQAVFPHHGIDLFGEY